MGFDNVKITMGMYQHLNHGPYRLLIHMAAKSLDNPSKAGIPARLYFGTWELQAINMGFTVPPAAATDTYSVETRIRARQRVWQSRTVLVQASAIKVLSLPSKGHPGHYLLFPELFP